MGLLVALGFATAVRAQPQDPGIQAIISPYTEAGQIGGVVTIVAKGADILSVNSAGFQDIAQGKAIGPESLFWIASQSKPMAGVAVMMLVEAGKLDLDEPITTYLPEMGRMVVSRVSRDDWQVEERISTPITLRHLLSHTSGMRWVGQLQEQAKKIDVIPLRLGVYEAVTSPLLFEPGERYSYSNQGINIAAAIIERVSGMKYEDFLQKRIFDPLDMRSATFWPTDDQLKRLVVPYKLDSAGQLQAIGIDQLQYPLSDRQNRFAEAAGGLFCTPSDLVKFYQMIACGGRYKGTQLLQGSSITELGRRQTPENVPESYGLGWGVGENFIGHAGAYGTDAKVFPDGELVTLYFVQEQGLPKSGEALTRFLDHVKEKYTLTQ